MPSAARILALTSLLAPLGTQAEERDASGVRRDVRIETYDVSGDSARQLRADLNHRRPSTGAGRFDAVTQWQVDWQLSVQAERGGCRITDPLVDLKIVMKLPRLAPARAVPAELERHWQRYVRALREHEDGHAAIGEAAAREVAGQLLRQPTAANCQAARRAADKAAQAVIAEHRLKDPDYDRRTEHGARQGARFP